MSGSRYESERQPGAFLVGPSADGQYRVRNAGNFAWVTHWIPLAEAAAEAAFHEGSRRIVLWPVAAEGFSPSYEKQECGYVDAVTLKVFEDWDEWAAWAVEQGLMPPRRSDAARWSAESQRRLGDQAIENVRSHLNALEAKRKERSR